MERVSSGGGRVDSSSSGDDGGSGDEERGFGDDLAPQEYLGLSIASSGKGGDGGATSLVINFGLFRVSAGDTMGRYLHSVHVLTLPMIPIFILLVQNVTDLTYLTGRGNEVSAVGNQVSISLGTQFLVKFSCQVGSDP